MEIKYSIALTANSSEPTYSLVMQKWSTDQEGNRIELGTQVKTGLSLEQSLTKIQQYIEEEGGVNG
jgi:hypothetical protein